VITADVRTKIHDFSKLIARTEKYMYQYKTLIKTLAETRDRFDKAFRTLCSMQPDFSELYCPLMSSKPSDSAWRMKNGC
jgi:hypothetical protein